MVALKICDVKEFTKKLLIGETFDRFLLKEAVIVTYNTFTIDGAVRRGYYSAEEKEAAHIGDYSAWRTLRPFCYSLIRGKRLPESFSIVLRLGPEQTGRFLADRRLSWTPEQVNGLFLHIRYEAHVLSCVTGVSMREFSLDRTLDQEWDSAVRAFLKKEELAFLEE